MSKETDLQALSDAVRDFLDQEIPPVGTWNVNPGVIRDGLALVGAFFTDTDASVTAITDTYFANHNPDGSHVAPAEWVAEVVAPTFISASSFTLPGDRRATYRAGDRLRLHQGAGGTTLVIVALDAIAFAPQTNATTFVVRTATTTAPVISTLVSLDRGLVRESFPRIGSFDLLPGVVNDPSLLADGIVTLAKLAPGSVDRARIIDGEVTAGKLGPDSVVASNIANGQVGPSELALQAVTSLKIATGAVLESHIADDQVLTRHVADLQITTPLIAQFAVDAAQLANGAVITPKLGDGQVTTPKIADKNVTPAKLVDTNYQSKGTNGLRAGVFTQRGWHFVTVATTENIWSKPITFPVAFPTALLGLKMFAVGVKIGSDPTSMLDTVPDRTNGGTIVDVGGVVVAQALGGSLSLAGFTAQLAANAASSNHLAPNDRLVFYWEADGH